MTASRGQHQDKEKGAKQTGCSQHNVFDYLTQGRHGRSDRELEKPLGAAQISRGPYVGEGEVEPVSILVTHRAELDTMASALIKYETLDESQIKDIMAGREVKPPEGWDDAGGGTGGKPATTDTPELPKSPPIATPAGQH